MKRHFMTRVLAAVLAVFLLSSCTPWKEVLGEDAAIRVYAAGDTDKNGVGENGTEAPEADAEAARRLYRDGRIHLFHYRQLQLIGTNTPVTTGDGAEDTMGLGQPITDDNGATVVYAKDAHYCLEGDIAMPSDRAWSLPDDFTGDFAAGQTAGEGQTPLNERLYDAGSDTVFIQNPYQLRTLSAVNRVDTPVMSGDWNAETFGTGQFLYPDGETGGYLTYSAGHSYLLSAAFSAEIPAAVSPALRMPVRGSLDPDVNRVDGRDWFGQVTVTVGGVEYILIGDRQQLQALDTGEDKVEVYGPVYKVNQEYVKVGTLNYEWQDAGEPELIYPGDADLTPGLVIGGQSVSFDSKPIFDGNEDEYHKLGTESIGDGLGKRTVYCTVNPATGAPDSSQTANPYNDLTYSRSANYIVFRDIDLKNEAWTPMMFNGSMIGVKGTGTGSLWDADKTALHIDTGNKAKITHINVVPAAKNGDLDVATNIGVGFFATLSGSLDTTDYTAVTSTVRNLHLKTGTVVNRNTDCYIEQTVVNGLTSFLGGLLGGLLGALEPVTEMTLGTQTVGVGQALSGLLDARKQDPSSLATGTFAGRIVGDVVVQDCLVEDFSVTAVKTSFEDNEKIVGTGGFVGHMEGEYQYDLLSAGLKGTVDGLTFLLNAIPGLGLGDLITILLDNGIDVGSLIPIGYISPRVENCTASACTMTNDAGKLGVGGFVGSQCGSVIRHSRVTGSNEPGATELSIEAERFGGGFAGVERDDVIKQTLSDLGVIVGKLYPQSEIIDCAIENTALRISGGHCLGGFIGAQANSYAINDTIASDCTFSVTADGDCIGGFTGMAQLGSSFGLTEYIPGGDSVLGTVSNLLKSVLSNDNSQALLAMGGVSQSAILGAQINCPLSVTSFGSQLGGLVGSGDGVYIAKTGNYTELNKYSGEKPEASDKPALYECFTLLEKLPDRGNVIASLTTVHTEPERGENGGDFVGGAAGRLVSANAGSLLGSTLGLQSYLGFRLSDLTVYGAEGGYSVKADGDYAGGAIGFAIGGDVKDVALYRLKSVTADNHAGGFVGTTGPDKVAGGNGLDLKLLNINVLKIDNLLNMTGGIHTIYENATVDGIDTGFTVEALGVRKGADETDFTAGGFAGDSTSVAMTDCKVNHLLRVHADKHHGMAGGFVGHSSAGSLAGVDKKKNDGVEAITVSQLLQIESDLVPAYESCEVSFVNGGYVEANAAGGFAGEFRSGTVNVKNDVQAY